MADEIIYKVESYEIIGLAMEVHRILGPGFLESVYEKALAFKFKNHNIPFKRQVEIEINYKGEAVGKFKADFFVYNKIIVELKASQYLIEMDRAQVINYIKATGIKLGLLINFGEPSLKYERFVNT